jgi:hypothetical protein
MAAKNGAHGYLLLVYRLRFEHDRQIITPFRQILIKAFDGALELGFPLWLQIILAIIYGVDFSKHASRDSV